MSSLCEMISASVSLALMLRVRCLVNFDLAKGIDSSCSITSPAVSQLRSSWTCAEGCSYELRIFLLIHNRFWPGAQAHVLSHLGLLSLLSLQKHQFFSASPNAHFMQHIGLLYRVLSFESIRSQFSAEAHESTIAYSSAGSLSKGKWPSSVRFLKETAIVFRKARIAGLFDAHGPLKYGQGRWQMT